MKRVWLIGAAVLTVVAVAVGLFWGTRKQTAEFEATVLEITEHTVVVAPLETEEEYRSAKRITFSTDELEEIEVEAGDRVIVSYKGAIRESDPAQITVTDWERQLDRRDIPYEGEWLDKQTAEVFDGSIFEHVDITEIYKDCFFATSAIPMPYRIKVNGTLSDEWCVGDRVEITYENPYYDKENHRVEIDLLTIKASEFKPDPFVAYKPVIYLYPERETEVSVKVALDGQLTCTYPDYGDGWRVTARPDGVLFDGEREYNYLYWEGDLYAEYDFSNGFCVKGEDTAAFLEETLEKLGLNPREANEFIVYWLPMMQKNPYNIISFQTKNYTEAAQLEISPAPDSVIRIFMAWKAGEKPIAIQEQFLETPHRNGFTVVEWGGTEIKK